MTLPLTHTARPEQSRPESPSYCLSLPWPFG